jgi:3'-phosphoadenosine 5'-phosphosulfate sulfotransferase (PAPS reductase)/FAD synthetase
MNHYAINGPTVISFSGGRTSAYMLHQTLEANNGLPSDAIVCFQNTGKEAPQTLDFVQECGQQWGVEIVWLEFAGFEPPGRSHCLFDIVTRETCKTQGEPFELLCEQLGILPNPVARTCTANLKIKTMIAYLKSIGWDEWDIFLGIRADEPSRAARMMKPGRDNRGGRSSVAIVEGWRWIERRGRFLGCTAVRFAAVQSQWQDHARKLRSVLFEAAKATAVADTGRPQSGGVVGKNGGKAQSHFQNRPTGIRGHGPLQCCTRRHV